MSETSEESTPDTIPSSDGFCKHPKRVILRLRVNEFDDCHPTEFDNAIMAYLKSAGRPADELGRRIHHSHIEPLQSPELRQTSFHIVLDIEKDMLRNPDLGEVDHEVHRVRRAEDGTLYAYDNPNIFENLAKYLNSKVNRIQDPVEEQNFVRKMRHFTDILYPWAK